MSEDNRQLFFDTLVGLGLKPYQALGALWSLGGESYPEIRTDAFNPLDPGGGSLGAGQWRAERRWPLENIARSMGLPATDPRLQARYLAAELTGTDKSMPGAIFQPGVLDALKAASTPEEAARAWTTKFERPRYDNTDERIRRGPAVGTLDAQGRLVLGAPGATQTPTTTQTPTAAQTPAQTPAPPDPWAQARSAIGVALGNLSSGLSSGGAPQVTDPPPQPAIRSEALNTNFVAPDANPVPMKFTGGGGGLGSQLGALAMQPQVPSYVDPSITQGAPSMTAMTQAGQATDPTMIDPRRTGSISPYSRAFSRLG
jgi:hypothetical protein